MIWTLAWQGSAAAATEAQPSDGKRQRTDEPHSQQPEEQPTSQAAAEDTEAAMADPLSSAVAAEYDSDLDRCASDAAPAFVPSLSGFADVAVMKAAGAGLVGGCLSMDGANAHLHRCPPRAWPADGYQHAGGKVSRGKDVLTGRCSVRSAGHVRDQRGALVASFTSEVLLQRRECTRDEDYSLHLLRIRLPGRGGSGGISGGKSEAKACSLQVLAERTGEDAIRCAPGSTHTTGPRSSSSKSTCCQSTRSKKVTNASCIASSFRPTAFETGSACFHVRAVAPSWLGFYTVVLDVTAQSAAGHLQF